MFFGRYAPTGPKRACIKPPSDERAVTLEDLDGEIAGREVIIYNMTDPPLGTTHALAHARKEWGRASGVESSAREFHLGIVQRDLRISDELMAPALMF